MSRTANKVVGRYGEQVATQHLTTAGLVILARNWRCSDGEIDIIAREGDAVVFCEVKTRRSEVYGPPITAIGPVKAQRLRRLALRWLTEANLRAREVRFDVVSVWPQPRGVARVEHLRGAF